MKKVWAVVLVKRGFIQCPEIYYSYKAAIHRKKTLLKDFNRDYDELEIFELSFTS
jgi:hypothetical protein